MDGVCRDTLHDIVTDLLITSPRCDRLDPAVWLLVPERRTVQRPPAPPRPPPLRSQETGLLQWTVRATKLPLVISQYLGSDESCFGLCSMRALQSGSGKSIRSEQVGYVSNQEARVRCCRPMHERQPG